MREVGLIGFPVAHSLSPRMQQAAFDACGIAARYTLWETPPADLPARIASLRAPEMLGANVTIPHKTAVISLVDDTWNPLAGWIAINTIVNRNGRLIGYNTDMDGLIQALAANKEHPFQSQGKRAVILGTGGAARGAAAALLKGGVVELILLGRSEAHLLDLLQQLETVRAAFASPTLVERLRSQGEGDLRSLIKERLETLPEPAPPRPGEVLLPPGHLRARSRDLRKSLGVPTVDAATFGSEAANQFLRQADLVVNATSVGLHEEDKQVLIDVNLLSPDTLVMDMIYNPPQTPLLHAAQARGCAVMNGLSMLLYQGAMAFELWTGQAAPLEIMQQALGLS